MTLSNEKPMIIPAMSAIMSDDMAVSVNICEIDDSCEVFHMYIPGCFCALMPRGNGKRMFIPDIVMFEGGGLQVDCTIYNIFEA